MTVTSGSATQHAGEDYTLTCTVSGGETTATTTYQWLRDNTPLSGETSATLSFSPLRQTTPSSNGQYVCEAMRSSRTVRSARVNLDVIGNLVYNAQPDTILIFFISVPPLTLVITPSGPPIEGETYSLTCDLMGDELLEVTATSIRWDKIRPIF